MNLLELSKVVDDMRWVLGNDAQIDHCSYADGCILIMTVSAEDSGKAA